MAGAGGGFGGMMGGMSGGGGGGGMPWAEIVKGAANSDIGNTQDANGGQRKQGNGLIGSVLGRAKSDSSKTKNSVISGAAGIVQQIQANKLKKRAESAFPDLVDPSQAAFLSELGQKRKSLDTGSAFATGMQNIDATQAGTNEALVRAAGGDTGSTMQALLQSQRVAGDSKNAVIAQGQAQQLAYTNAYQGMLDQIAARKLQLQMQRSQQAQAEWAAKQKVASQNLMAAVSTMTAGGGAPKVSGTSAPNTVAQGANLGGGTGLSALDNTGLGFGAKTAPAPTMQQSTFGTVSDSPVIDRGVQQEAFGSTSGKNLNADFLSNVRGGFKK